MTTDVSVHELASRSATYTFPFILVLAYLFVDFGRPQDWFPALRVLHLGMWVLGGGIIAFLVYPRATIPRVGKYLILFLAVMAVGVPFAHNRYYAFVTTKDFALFLFGAVLPIMAFVVTREQLRILFRVWVAIHVLLAIYCLRHNGAGIGSFLGDENDFALAMNLVLPYAFFMLFVVRSQIERLFLAGSVVLFLLAVTTTLSRGGFLGLLTVGLFCWLFTPRKIVTSLIVVALTITVVAVKPASYWDEMNTIKTANQEGDTGHQRLYFWGIAWRMFLDYPILGVGPSNFQYTAYLYEGDEGDRTGIHIWGRVCHSLYFTLLSEEGMVGTAVFALIIVSAWSDRKRIRAAYKEHIQSAALSESTQQDLKTIYYMTLAIDASLVGLLVSGAFITVLYYPHVWLLTAFSVVLRRGFDAAVTAPAREVPGMSPQFIHRPELA